MIDIKELMRIAVERDASDIFIVVGVPPTLKIEGSLVPLDHEPLDPEETEQIAMELFKREEHYNEFIKYGDNDFSLSIKGVGRFRIGVYTQRGSMSVTIRVLSFDQQHKLKVQKPKVVLDLYKESKGLILITGPASSGKSTTVSQIVDLINENRACHIITLEDPIEFLHKHKKSIVEQREIGIDAVSFSHALKSAVRQAPDVIVIGELKNNESIAAALDAAETGQLVISTLHTQGAVKTIERVIDTFPEKQQQQIRFQMSENLNTIVTQQLLPSNGSGRVPAFEIVRVNQEISRAIRDNRIEDLDELVSRSDSENILGMDISIAKLYLEGRIDRNVAEKFCFDRKILTEYLDHKL